MRMGRFPLGFGFVVLGEARGFVEGGVARLSRKGVGRGRRGRGEVKKEGRGRERERERGARMVINYRILNMMDI